ncbi:hypothetical protein E2C01_092189 [Portunus trituberculatus]|uniref:Uncharacterized protein n=1 Tax=Portunus trituberculatus TaxID=210409 RepID=A0A5B7JV51_PORTR|nr:hypothetical protein [Portunus trituberculatus]
MTNRHSTQTHLGAGVREKRRLFSKPLIRDSCSRLRVGTLLEEAELEDHEMDGFPNECPLIPLNTLDWIYKVPVLVFLSLNVLFLIRIMWVSGRNIGVDGKMYMN